MGRGSDVWIRIESSGAGGHYIRIAGFQDLTLNPKILKPKPSVVMFRPPIQGSSLRVLYEHYLRGTYSLRAYSAAPNTLTRP